MVSKSKISATRTGWPSDTDFPCWVTIPYTHRTKEGLWILVMIMIILKCSCPRDVKNYNMTVNVGFFGIFIVLHEKMLALYNFTLANYRKVMTTGKFKIPERQLWTKVAEERLQRKNNSWYIYFFLIFLFERWQQNIWSKTNALHFQLSGGRQWYVLLKIWFIYFYVFYHSGEITIGCDFYRILLRNKLNFILPYCQWRCLWFCLILFWI